LPATDGTKRGAGDDAEREVAYDNGAKKALAEADKRGWTVVSMKDVFTTLFDAADLVGWSRSGCVTAR
jgi:hypothetical protein